MTTTELKACSVCQALYAGFGHNAQPINDGRCCDDCNRIVVLARVRIAMRSRRAEQDAAKESGDGC